MRRGADGCGCRSAARWRRSAELRSLVGPPVKFRSTRMLRLGKSRSPHWERHCFAEPEPGSGECQDEREEPSPRIGLPRFVLQSRHAASTLESSSAVSGSACFRISSRARRSFPRREAGFLMGGERRSARGSGSDRIPASRGEMHPPERPRSWRRGSPAAWPGTWRETWAAQRGGWPGTHQMQRR